MALPLHRLKLPILACIALLTCTACYRMPSENDYSVIPAVNNRDLTGDDGKGGVPQISY